MKSKKLMSKVITAVVAGSVLLSTGSFVFAKSNADGTTGDNTKRQETRINKKASAENMKTELDKLVTAGTITADQETKVLDYFKQKDTERQAEMDKIKNMTEAERKTYFENNKPAEKTNFLSELVTSGTLTQEQADAIAKVTHRGPGGGKGHGMGTEGFKNQLDKLVTAGTITQDEENKILDFMNQKQTEKKAEMDKVKNMTEAERKTYFENNKKEKTDLTAELVTAGIISQEKADAIKAAMPAAKDHGPMQQKQSK